ncbi:thiamine-phosphate pyrophosphorylase [candidate division WOR-3 bacterium]|nr:thiamine-phosphate pyrophosphorylase [candidate division WOR-3 bacterium]
MDRRSARIIDANLNRLSEGLKVVEDIARLGMEHKGLLRGIRALRTRLGNDTLVLRRRVVLDRHSEDDPGRPDRFDRGKRRDLGDVLAANFKRCQEACRVLEEVLKVDEPRLGAGFKQARFRLYDLERDALAALARRPLD